MQLRIITFGCVLAGLVLVLGPAPIAAKEKIHEVKPGDSIAKIANFYGVSQRDLKTANGLGKGSFLDVGDILVIPEMLRGAGKGHRVKAGDTLVQIAKKHKVSVKALARANRLGKKARLKIGRVLVIPGTEGSSEATAPEAPKRVKGGRPVKGGVMHTVQSGQSLWTIARAYDTTVDSIVKRNKLSKEDTLQVGQELMVPGVKGVVASKRKSGRSSVRFVRVHNNKRASLQLFNRKGRLNQESRRVLSKLCRDRRGKRRFRLLHPRLIRNLQRVADHFPGQTIEIVSGYRSPRRGHRRSKHGLGQAVDFKVSGVPNKTLYNFVRSLPKVGAGYYPNSTFVHMDVRDRSYTWTDVSAPGEAPKYITPSDEQFAESEADVASAGDDSEPSPGAD